MFRNFTVLEVLIFGMFTDNNISSPLYGATGILRMNNMTMEVTRMQNSFTYGSSSSSSSSYGSSSSSYGSSSYGGSSSTPGVLCIDIFGGANSIVTNASNT